MEDEPTLFKKILWSFLALLGFSLFAFVLWYTDDIDDFDESAFLPPDYINVPAADNGYPLLEDLATEFEEAISAKGNNLSELVHAIDDNQSEVLNSEFSKNLPVRLQEVLNKKSFQEKEMTSFDDALPSLSFYRNVIRVLKVQILLSWRSGNKRAAFEQMKLADDFTKLFGEQTQSIIGVLVSVAMHGIIDQARVEILDEGDFDLQSLKLLQTMNDRTYLQRQMKIALQWEYKLIYKLINEEVKGVKTFAYCENRTKAFYIDAMQPFYSSLEQKPFYLDGKFIVEFDAKIKNYKADIFHSRNTIGRIFMAMCIPGIGPALKKIKSSYIRKDLVQLRIALEIYRVKMGSFPAGLNELKEVDSFLKDPWTNYQTNYGYDLANGKIYSVGENLKDNGGVIQKHKTEQNTQNIFDSKAPDFGLSFK